MESKTVSETAVTMAVMMLPSDANPFGHVHGGTIMKLVDSAAGVVAHRHARSLVSTVRIDDMSFLAPVYVGNLVSLKASMNAVGRTSMEIGVRVEAEDLFTGKVTHTSSAYLVFVALDEHRNPIEVPRLVAETSEQQRRMSEAESRRSHRLAGRDTA
jgi:acyl-CoA hydrolase